MELAPQQIRKAQTTVKIKMPPEEDLKSDASVTAVKLRFALSPIIQGKYDLTVISKNADRLMEQWMKFFDLDSADHKVTEPYKGHSLLSLTEYPADDSAQLLRLDLARTGHLLLVDPGKAINQGGQYSLFTKDVNFHLPYWIVEFFGLVK